MQPVRDAMSYADLSALVGRRFTVDTHDLVLERVSTPWRWEGRLSYSVLLTGPVADALPLGLHLLTDGEVTFALDLEPVARDVRFVHYEAWLTEAVESDLPVAS